MHSAQWAFSGTLLIIMNKRLSLSFPLFGNKLRVWKNPIILNKCSTAGFWDLKKTNRSKLATQNRMNICMFIQSSSIWTISMMYYRGETIHWCIDASWYSPWRYTNRYTCLWTMICDAAFFLIFQNIQLPKIAPTY